MISPHDSSPACGVYDHAERLSEALRAGGDDIVFVKPDAIPATGVFDLVHLHFVPFLFRGWGAGAFDLMLRLRRRAPVVLTVHEPRIDYGGSPRRQLLALGQDALLQALVGIARAVIVPTAAWLPYLRGREASVIPAGSTLALDAAPRPEPTHLVIGVISSGHAGRLPRLASAAARAAGERRSADVVGLGVDRGDGIAYTGYLDYPRFEAALASCSLLVLPYLDGVSGRRTSFISALQLGIPTATTLMPGFDDFPAIGFVHAAPEDSEGFGLVVDRLSADADLRGELRGQARHLYEDLLSWPVLAARTRVAYQSALA